MAETKTTTYKLGDRLTLAEATALGVKPNSMAHIWGESARDGRYARLPHHF